jgi:predicted ATPase/transcriptional regulator with XRE-family HTH domain
MQTETEFARLLRAFMRQRSINQEQFARLTGIRKATIHNWLTGKTVTPTYPHQVLKAAGDGLRLTKSEANRLLAAAGMSDIDSLIRSRPDLLAEGLLARWQAAAVPNNLPAPLNRYIGHEHEIAETAHLLTQPDARLVTLTGSGGSGKTRLSLETAREVMDSFPEGVYFVPLAGIDTPELVVPTIAQTLGLRESPEEPLEQRVANYLRDRQALLVLDNLEQVAECGPRLTALLLRTAKLTIMVSSRVPLRVTGENVRVVAPFDVPLAEASFDEIKTNPAVQLFVERAQAVGSSLKLTSRTGPEIARLCRWLDGLPLAIELVAVRLRSMSFEELTASVDSRLALAVDGPRDVEPRHQSLWEATDWSYRLLSPTARTLFGRLAVFRGGWDRDDTFPVCLQEEEAGPTWTAALNELLDFSLVEHDPAYLDVVRLRMLETVREYAAARLMRNGAGEETWLNGNHARHLLTMAETLTDYMPLEVPPRAWRERMDRDQDNVRKALSWSMEIDPPVQARLAAVCWPYWHETGALREGLGWLTVAVEDGHQTDFAVNARLQTALCCMNYSLTLLSNAKRHGEVAIEVAKQVGDTRSQAIAELYLERLSY